MKQSEKFTLISIEERLEGIQTDLRYLKNGNLNSKEKDIITWLSAKTNDLARTVNELKKGSIC